MARWQTDSSDVVYETPWITVRRDEIRNHNGKALTYSVVHLNSPSVFVIAVNADGDIFLQKNYRYTLGKEMWEMPAGHSDGEDHLEAAKRELLEEAGLTSTKWTDLGTFYQAVGIGNIPARFFLAEDVVPAAQKTEVDEELTDQHFVSPAELDTMVARGEMGESAFLAILYLYKVHISARFASEA